MFKIINKNKRGFLLAEETLKIVLSVIGIGFLVFLLGSLYFSGAQENKLEHARSVLKGSGESLESVIQTVKNGEGSLNDGSAENFTFTNPRGWSLFSFTREVDKNIPNPCANKNCVCICNSRLIKDDNILSKGQVRECGEEGACLVIKDLNKFEEIEIKRGVNEIKVSENESGLFIQETNN